MSGTAAADVASIKQSEAEVGTQTRAALRRAIYAMEQLGGEVNDVVRTRLYVVVGSDIGAVARAHQEVFADVMPANTTVYVPSLPPGPNCLVEVELEAELAAEDS